MVGTEFQLRVWDALVALPYGFTLSYAALTERVLPSAPRCGGGTLRMGPMRSPSSCHHRGDVGSSGELMGYAGGIPTKRSLLRLEAGVEC
ncbi:MAG: methylated-DNA--[protein]-cysteine S-methyltransferase [Flavobacteriales bacterium]|nr:methylated-DNA--[protein]-cysteine S-methyltransferase [Flavobacteriales bacterium]